MRNAGIESSIYSVRRDPSHNTLICAEPAALPGVRSDLESVFLNYSMDSLLINR